MKICLVNPCPDFVIDTKVFPPLGLLYVAAAAERAGHEVYIHDACLDEEEVPDGHDVYGITCNIIQIGWIKRWFQSHRERNPKSWYAIGGPYIGTTRETLGFDFALAGEGEEEFPRWLELARDYAGFFGSNPNLRRVVANPVNINAGIYPARHLINIHEYKYLIDGRLATPMMTMRGCPYNCAFCCKRPEDSKVRFRDIDDVLKELDEIIGMGFRAVRFYDDTFNLNIRRAIELCGAIKSLDLFWKAEIRASLLNYAFIEAMASSGCKEVAIGIESGSQKILDNVNKKVSVAQNRIAVKMFQEYGIRVRAYLIIGLPGEDHETIQETRKWLAEARPDSFGLGIYTPYPGSDIWQSPQNYDIKFSKNMNPEDLLYRTRPDEYRCFVSTSTLTAQEILGYRDSISREFDEMNKYGAN